MESLTEVNLPVFVYKLFISLESLEQILINAAIMETSRVARALIKLIIQGLMRIYWSVAFYTYVIGKLFIVIHKWQC